MIRSITFPKSKKAYTYTEKAGLRSHSRKAPMAYVADQRNLAGKTFKFTPGLNILIGQSLQVFSRNQEGIVVEVIDFAKPLINIKAQGD